jgi:hypothetical protein
MIGIKNAEFYADFKNAQNAPEKSYLLPKMFFSAPNRVLWSFLAILKIF